MAALFGLEQTKRIREQLTKIIASARFRDSPRICAFLRYVVDRALLGRPEEIKETLIAMEVYGRGDGFDPQSDSIVRVEASRLRSKLRDYYLDEGVKDAVRIELPKGTYVPQFEFTNPLTPPASTDPFLSTVTFKSLMKPEPKPFPPWVIAISAVGVVAALLLYWFAYHRPSSTPAPQPVARRVAVLPFADLSEQGDLEYFCDGLAEEIINDLSRIPGLSVLARGSSFLFRGSNIDAREAGKKLNVDRILIGSVRRSGRKMRVTAQFVDVATGAALWSTSFDRESRDPLIVQDEISKEVANSLQTQLASSETAPRRAENAEAQGLYLKGRYLYWKSNAEDEARALKLFEEAVQIDPNYAAAWAGIADVLSSMPLRGLPLEQGLTHRAREAAERANTLDPNQVEGILARAHIARYIDYDWVTAERLYQQAIALQPGAARPRNSYGVLLSLMGRNEDAELEFRQALRLDPLSMQVQTNLTLNLYRMGRYQEAIDQARKAIAFDPTYRNIYSPMAASLAELGNYEEALQILARVQPPQGGEMSDNHLGLKGYIAARAGDDAAARAALVELQKRSAARYVPRAALADVYLGMGDNLKAMDLMEQGLKAKEVLLAGLLVSPHTQAIRGHPRFVAMQKAVARR